MFDKLLHKVIIYVCIAATIIIPGMYLLNSYLDNQQLVFKEFLVGVLFTVVVTLSISIVNFFIFKRFRDNYSHKKGYVKTWLIEVIVTSITAAIVMAMVILIFLALFDDKHVSHEENLKMLFFHNILIAIIVNLIVMGFVEGYTLFLRWKTATIESERLLREKADARYAALKNQVNPHFLFNSLNSLSSLIRKSPEDAIDFVDKFSRIYRYVLDAGDIMLIELREEIDFISSFVFLQKIRFGDNLQIEINTDAQFLGHYLAPLSVQLLVENAIKHNEISSEYPLKIEIFVEDGYLVVSNLVRFKTSFEKSTGIGLKNLEERYLYLTDHKPVFKVIDGKFVAKVPLLSENEL